MLKRLFKIICLVVNYGNCFEAGEKVYINTITYHYLGEVIRFKNGFVYLTKCSWIPSTGAPFSGFLKNGNLKANGTDFEPMLDVFRLNVDAIVGVTKWRHELPKEK